MFDFLKFLFTNKCPKCKTLMQEHTRWNSDKYSTWQENTFACPNGCKSYTQSGKSEPFR
jgi:hypothetical protein